MTTAVARTTTATGTAGEKCLAMTGRGTSRSLARSSSTRSECARRVTRASTATAPRRSCTTRTSLRSVCATRRSAAPAAATAPSRTRGRSSSCRTSASRRRRSPPRNSSLTNSKRSGARLEARTIGRAASMHTPTGTGGARRSSATPPVRVLSGTRASATAWLSSATTSGARGASLACSRTDRRSSCTTRSSTKRAPAASRAAGAAPFAPSRTARTT
mmetsp:Transcript_89693/g.258735  ORF Transcript_89693/g.258735 Transcript_89693/m.258735 type:complete len:217 (+) Transcript_89693:221-871(+)